MRDFDPDDTGTDPRPKHSGRWLRRAGLIVVVSMALTLIAHAWWAGQAGRRLAATVARYRAAGEPMAPEDLATPPVPDAQNAVVDLRAAAAANIDPGKELNRPVALPLTAVEAATLKRLVETNRYALAKARLAAGKSGVDWHLRYQSPLLMILLPDLNQQRQLALLLSASALYAHHAGNDAEAVRRLREILRVSRAVDEQPFLISHLVATGIAAIAVERAQQIAPALRIGTGGEAASATADGTPARGGTPADEAELRLLLADLLDAAGPIEGMKRALRGERVMQVDAAYAVVDGKLDLALLEGLTGTSARRNGSPAASLGRYTLRPTILSDARLMAEQVAGDIAAAGEPNLPAARAKMPPSLKARIIPNHPLHVFAGIMAPTFDRAFEGNYHHLTDRRLAATALAIRWYTLDHGAPPQQLSDLVPRYLPAVPLDPMAAGWPLIYQPADGHSDDPIVYSVGDNATDDGGSDKPLRQTRTPVANPSNVNVWALEDRVLHLKRQRRTPPDPEEDEEPGTASPGGTTHPTR